MLTVVLRTVIKTVNDVFLRLYILLRYLPIPLIPYHKNDPFGMERPEIKKVSCLTFRTKFIVVPAEHIQYHYV